MSEREPWRPTLTGTEKLEEMMGDVRDLAEPRPWSEPDPMQPVFAKLLEAYRLNRLSQNEVG